MVKNISPKQKRIVKAKIKGKTNKEIGQVEYPDATPGSQEVLVSRQLNKSSVAQYYEQSKMIALKEHNITWSRIIEPVSKALDAHTDIRDRDGNIVDTIPDLNTQLRASKQAQELLRVKEELDPTTEATQILPNNIDEIQMIRLLKNK